MGPVILDDASLTRLTRMAGDLLGVPVSVVSSPANPRRFVSGAREGRDPSGSHSFCEHVVEHGATLIVEDSRRSPLAATAPDAVAIAYAGVPLTLQDGHAVGALCAIDDAPRSWSERDVQVLTDLAALTTDVLESRRANVAHELHDRLTGLPGRSLFGDLVTRSLAQTGPSGKTSAILAFGLDGFRLINEAFGHDAGDKVLIAAAERLSNGLQNGGAVCRVAGDEFLVLCDGLHADPDGAGLADRVHRELTDAPLRLGEQSIPIRASVGVALARTPVATDDLIDAALDALTRSKAGAPVGTGAPDPHRRRRAAGRLRLQNSVAGAQERGELHLAYQPLVDLHSGRVTSLEALLRWTDPELGTVAPDDFIPAAERSGAILPIGRWAIEQAAVDLARWRGRPATRELTVAVNLAPVQLRTPGMLATVRDVLARHGLPGNALTLEITERVLLDDRPVYTRAMHQLRALGARIALDDFGTGYSALSYLTCFPFDAIKLDRSFVAALGGDPRGEALVEAITTMAGRLGLRTVAEGIETAEQLACVTRLGCDLGQGYHLARPLPAGDIALTRYA